MPRGVDPNRKPFRIFAAREVAQGDLPPNDCHPLGNLPPAARLAAFENAFVRRVRVQTELRMRQASSDLTSPTGVSEEEGKA